MSFEVYSLKFSMLSKYALSLVFNSRVEMSRFLTGVADLVNEECRTTMLHDDMTLARIMVYAQSIKDSKHNRMSRNLKGMVQVIKINLGPIIGLKFKKNL